MTARRHLPPLNALRAFEAAARGGSFTRAAQELLVTQGAVSRHVLLLEKWLGRSLFVRTRRGIEVTPEGAAYFAAVRSALDGIEQETGRLLSNASEKTLRLKLPPTFAIRWLVPRLAHFHALNRHIDVQITTSHQPVDLAREDVDICIHSGSAPLPGARCLRLFREVLLPVGSPGVFRRESAPQNPDDLARHVLLCSLHRPGDWPAWLAATGAEGVDGNSGLKFENSALAYQAAIDELGIVMAQLAFVEDDLASGRLAAPLPHCAETGNAYYLASSANRVPSAKVAAFESWIGAQAATVETAMKGRLRGLGVVE